MVNFMKKIAPLTNKAALLGSFLWPTHYSQWASRGFDGHNGTFLTAPALRRGRRANPKIDCAASNTLAAGRYDFY